MARSDKILLLIFESCAAPLRCYGPSLIEIPHFDDKIIRVAVTLSNGIGDTELAIHSGSITHTLGGPGDIKFKECGLLCKDP